jgi:phage terminase large subunit
VLTQIQLPYQFEPRHYQRDLLRAFFVEKKKRLIPIWHRRAGKTKNAVNFITGAALQETGLYFHLFPEQKQAKKAVWKGLDKEGKRYLDHIPKSLIRRENNTEMTIELVNGSIIQMAGADNYNSLMGSNPKGIIFDEYSIQNPLAWNYLRPILAENGGWAMFPYTPRGKNHGYDLYETNKNNPDWFIQKLGITQTFRNDGTPVITQEIVNKEIAEGMPEEMAEQEYHVSFDAALPGAYFSKEMRLAENQKRIGKYPFNPQLPVYTFWDLGVSDSTVIIFAQAQAGKIVFIDYYENNNQGMNHYLDYIKEKQTSLGYRYERHYGPHDIANTEWGAGKTRLQQAYDKGVKFHVVPRTKNKQEDINRLRTFFPRIHINEDKCGQLKNALSSYHREYNHKLKIFSDSPKHDWASHPVDACFCMSHAWKDWFEHPQQVQGGTSTYSSNFSV